jgi:hypothetical protein
MGETIGNGTPVRRQAFKFDTSFRSLAALIPARVYQIGSADSGSTWKGPLPESVPLGVTILDHAGGRPDGYGGRD